MATKVSEEVFYHDIVNNYTDVINEKVGGKVVLFSDEFFAEASNLITAGDPIQDKTRFVPTGKWYDGWETRRHNTEEADWVVFQVGVASAQLVGVEVDTAFFSGNHAPAISVEAAVDENSEWESIISKIECGPSQRHFFVKPSGLTENSYTRVRLRMYPDGGIARFRVYGKVVPVFSANATAIDVASVENGGVAIQCSDQHFSRASNLLLPGRGNDMSDGWETSRSREEGHFDWVIIRLGKLSSIQNVVIDTAYFRGNFPQQINVKAIKFEDESKLTIDSEWIEIVPNSKTTADKEHEFEVSKQDQYTHVLVSIIPDGGIKRVRVIGTPA